MKPPLNARWLGPWVRGVPGFVAVTRQQAARLRKANAAAEILATLKQGRERRRPGGYWMRPHADFLFYARPEDLKAAGLSPLGRGWRGVWRA